MTSKTRIGYIVTEANYQWGVWIAVTAKAALQFKMGFTRVTHAALGDDSWVYRCTMSYVTINTGNFCFVLQAKTFNRLWSSIMTFGTVVRTQSWACAFHSRGLHRSSGCQ